MGVRYVLEQLDGSGVTVEVDCTDLVLRPGSSVPPELILEIRCVRETGICRVWCTALDDYVAYVRDDDFDRALLPPGFVVYTGSELMHIAGLSPDGLLRIHAAKRTGAIVTGSKPETLDQPSCRLVWDAPGKFI